MTKIALSDIDSTANLQSLITSVNTNNTEIETRSDEFLSRDGTTPNNMFCDLDMNSYRVYNLPEAVGATEPIRKGDLADLIDQILLDYNLITED